MSRSPAGAAEPERDLQPDQPTAWLVPELGVADTLRLNVVDIGAPAQRHGRQSLVLHAAWTLLGHADVASLAPIAQREIAAGLGGPLRHAIAATPADGDEAAPLRDQLITHLSGTSSRPGAIAVADQVHLRRLVTGHVPAIIALGCLFWYRPHRHAHDPHAEAITTLEHLHLNWIRHPEQRHDIDEQTMAIATTITGRHPTSLIDDLL